MKKILLPILALGGLLFASSCQMDEPDAGTLTGEVDFSITAGIPAGITTYNPDDGKAFSHLGGINNVTGDYELRFILEVYDGNAVAYKEIKYLDNFSNPNVTFNPRLLAKEYDFVFWADFVKKPSADATPADLYYNTDNGLTSISYTDKVTAEVLTTDLVDAYYAVEEVDLTQSSQSVPVTLTRPFGKIRLLATDAPQNIENQNSNIPVSATIAFTDATVPATFNARTGKASEPTLSVTGYTFTAVKEPSPVVNGHSDLAQEGKFAYLLGQTYFFESPVSTAYKMTVTVHNATEQIGYRELTNIPVSANKLTTVIGNFYTNEGNIDVVVDDMFDEDETVYDVPETINVTTSAGIQDAIDAAQDGDIIVIGPGTYGAFDVTKSETQSFFQLPTDKSLTFRGANAGVAGTGIRSEETVITIPFTYAHSTTTTADFTFDGLKFTENGRVSVGKASTGDLTFINNIVTGITINSDPGTTFFTTPYVYDNNSYTMEDIVVENNLVDGTTLSDGTNSCGFRMWGISSATFKNNTFKNFDHSASQFDHVTGDLNFDGNTFKDCDNYKFRVQVINIEGERNYGSNEEDVTEKGVVLNETTGVAYDSIREAVVYAADGETIAIAEGNYDMTKLTAIAGKTLTFVGAGENTIFDYSSQAYNEYVNGGNGTFVFKNMTIQRSTETFAGMAHTASTSYENCTITGTYYVYETTAKFTNCKFNVKGDFYNCWTWGALNATFDGCTFNSDGKAMLLYGQANTKLTINNCTFNDNGGLDVKKAAIEIGDDYGSSYELIVNNTVVNGFAINDEGINTGTTLWANKNSMPKDKLSVTVDGVENPIYANSQDELAKATIENNATIFLAAGKYTIPSSAKGKTLTIKGTGNPEDVEVAVTKVGTGYENVDYGLDGSTVTFEGITITTNSSTYIGYARCKGTYKNCVINGTYTLYGDSEFENCTFNVSGDVYNIWTWGAPQATFDGCTFNSDGKAMLLYGTENTNLTIENSVFNDKGALTDLKAAIEIGNDYDKSYTLVVNNTVVNGYEINDKGINTGTTLWANKNSMPKEQLSVTVDGVKVY